MRFTGVIYILAFIIGTFIVLYTYRTTGAWLSEYLVIPAIIATTAYMLGPQINLWWYKRKPPKLDAKIKRIFEHYSSYYRELDKETKALFDSRIVLYIEDKDWIHMGLEDEMPYDIRAIIAFQPVRMTLHQKNYLLQPVNRVIVYPYPFLSPGYPKHYHASEFYAEDGAVLFSLRHLLPAFNEPEKYFNIVLYEYAKVFRQVNTHIQYPVLDEQFWRDLYRVANYGHSEIRALIGMPDPVDDFGVAVHHYFIYGKYFRDVYPELSNHLDNIFLKYNLTSGS